MPYPDCPAKTDLRHSLPLALAICRYVSFFIHFGDIRKVAGNGVLLLVCVGNFIPVYDLDHWYFETQLSPEHSNMEDNCIKGAEVRLLYIYNLSTGSRQKYTVRITFFKIYWGRSCILFGLSCLCPVPDQLHVVCVSLMQHKRFILTACSVYVISNNVCTCIYNYFFQHSQDCLWQCQWTCCRSAIKFVAL